MEKPSLESKTQKESILNKLNFIHNTECLEPLEMGKYGRALIITQNVILLILTYRTKNSRGKARPNW